MAWLTPIRHAPLHMCYHVEFDRSMSSKGVNPNRGNPKIEERWGSASLGLEAWLIPSNTPLPHTVLPYRRRSFCVTGCRRKCKNGECWGSVPIRTEGATDPENTLSPHMCYHVKFSRCASKSVRINRRKPPQLGSGEAPPLAGVAIP